MGLGRLGENAMIWFILIAALAGYWVALKEVEQHNFEKEQNYKIIAIGVTCSIVVVVCFLYISGAVK